MALQNVNHQVTRLLTGATANGDSDIFQMPIATPARVFSGRIEGTGSVSATLTIRGSIDGENWTDLVTLALSGTGSDDKFDEDIASWPLIKANVASISGTGASVDAWMGI